MADPLRALTLWQPWAWAIFHGKPVENRGWPCPSWMLGKPLAIHGGKRYDAEGDAYVCKQLGLERLPPEAHAQGLLGIVRPERNIEACIDREADCTCDFCIAAETCSVARDQVVQGGWFFGPYGWVFREQVEFREPVPCRGAQGLWVVPPDVTVLVRQRFQEARRAL